MREAPVRTLGLGTAVFFSVPPVALLLIITIIGIPVGILIGAFYAVALLAAYVVTCFFIGDTMARAMRRTPRTRWSRLLLLMLGLVILSLVTTLPYIGRLLLLLACIAGLGAIGLQAFSRYSSRKETPAHVPLW
jgi:hypothetical protein